MTAARPRPEPCNWCWSKPALQPSCPRCNSTGLEPPTPPKGKNMQLLILSLFMAASILFVIANGLAIWQHLNP